MQFASKRAAYLLNIPFLFGLFFLLLNDHYLKATYHNWYTGKISDFAGVLILPFFLKFIFNCSNRAALISTGLFFIFWKSPLAAYLINGLNTFGLLHFGRVLDYSDLLALLILPIAGKLLHKLEEQKIKTLSSTVWPMRLVFALSLFAFVATSTDDELFPVPDQPIGSCCETPVGVQRVGDGKVFIPTIFTPDGDGINDVFQVFVDTGIAVIEAYEIFSTISTDTILKVENVDPASFQWWDGLANDTIQPSTFFYRIQVLSTDSVRQAMAGMVCVIPCTNPTGLPKPANLDACGFATQYDLMTGIFDPTTPSMEELNCFE